MKVSAYILTIVLILLLSNAVYAQKSWTLNDCIAYALEHNLQLNDFKYNTASDKETYRQTVRDLLPRIRGVADYSIRFGRSVDPNDNSISNTQFFSNNYSLESSLDLFQGFQKINAIRASKLIYNATKEEALQQKYLLAFSIMEAYYDILFFEGALRIAEDQLEISKTNYALVKKQIDLGLVAGADIYEAESLLLADELSLVQVNNQLIAAKLALIQQMNLEESTDIKLTPEKAQLNEVEGKIASVDSIYSEAQRFLPLIKAGKLRVEAAQKQLAVERGRLSPSLSIFGGYGSGYFETIVDSTGNTVPFRDQFRDNTFQFVGVELVIPISGGWSARSRIKQQKIARLRAKNNLEVQKQELFQTIQSLVQENNALKIEFEQTLKNREAQNQSFLVAQKRYEKGIINAIELFTAKNLFATAQNQHLQVSLRLEVNNANLDFYSGLPVFNISSN
ncbi:TolC family protein [Flavobacteriaceae bacterium M23B6Z8]